MGNPFFDFKKKDMKDHPEDYKNKTVPEQGIIAGKHYREYGPGSKKTKGGAAPLSPAPLSGGALAPLTPTPLSGGKKKRRASKKNKSKKNKSKKNKSKKNKTRKSRR
jgi:hypothetical protein